VQLRQSGHPYIDVIHDYYLGCNTGDVVHYFVDHSKVVGAAAIANYWAKVGPMTQAHWTLDHCVVQEPEAVIEWTMQWTPPQTGESELLRGSEWYLFHGERIREIRSYHCNHYLQDPANRELRDFAYAARGYPSELTER